MFATHFVGALLVAIPGLGLALSGYQLIWYFATHRVIGGGELWLVLSLLVPFALDAGAAQRVVYRGRRAATLLRTALLTASVALAIPAFKLALFFVTLYWIGA